MGCRVECIGNTELAIYNKRCLRSALIVLELTGSKEGNMKTFVAIVMGFFSGILIYFLAGMMFSGTSPPTPPSPLFVGATLIGGWFGSSYLMVKGAVSVSKVFSRGFLIGAAEWFSLLPISLLFVGKTVAESAGAGSSGAHTAGAVIGGGLVASLAGGLSIGMAVFCLIGFAISYSLGKEMKPEVEPSQPSASPQPVMQSQSRTIAQSNSQSAAVNLYTAIGISSTATTDEIEKACISLGQKYMEESKAGSLQAAIRLKEVEQAFEILGNPEKRKSYDLEINR